SIVIESGARDPAHVAPLPNLDRHIRVGDALSGDDVTRGGAAGAASIGPVRALYSRAVGMRKRTLARTLDRAERAAALSVIDRRMTAINDARRDILVAARGGALFCGP